MGLNHNDSDCGFNGMCVRRFVDRRMVAVEWIRRKFEKSSRFLQTSNWSLKTKKITSGLHGFRRSPRVPSTFFITFVLYADDGSVVSPSNGARQRHNSRRHTVKAPFKKGALMRVKRIISPSRRLGRTLGFCFFSRHVIFSEI